MAPEQSTAKSWFITGTSRGLGRALAEAALARGDRVFATARNADALSGLQAQYPSRCSICALDVTDPVQVQDAVQQANATLGQIDVLVNNAGSGLVGALEELTDAEIRENFEANFFGPLAVTRAFLPIFRAQRSGHVINVSAAAAISNYPGFSIYGAAKLALEGAAESLAQELKPFGVKITCVQPGPFRTGFVGKSLRRSGHALPEYMDTAGKFARLITSMDGKQPGDPARAAEAILKIADAEHPPLRFALGRYAHDKIRRKVAALERERAAWAAAGEDTDFRTANP